MFKINKIAGIRPKVNSLLVIEGGIVSHNPLKAPEIINSRIINVYDRPTIRR